MKRLRWLAMVGVGVMAVGCGDSGLKASGAVQLTVHQSGQADGSTGFSFPDHTSIDAPPGVGTGFYGTCQRAGSGWSVTLTRADASSGGLRTVTVTAPDGAGQATVAFTLDTGTFRGTCTSSAGTADHAGAGDDDDLQVTATCAGLSLAGDPRTVDATIHLTLEECSGT